MHEFECRPGVIQAVLRKCKNLRHLNISNCGPSTQFEDLFRIFRNVSMPLETLLCSGFCSKPDAVIDPLHPFWKIDPTTLVLSPQPLLTKLDMSNIFWITLDRILFILNP
jgi:hypothetical protein